MVYNIKPRTTAQCYHINTIVAALPQVLARPVRLGTQDEVLQLCQAAVDCRIDHRISSSVAWPSLANRPPLPPELRRLPHCPSQKPPFVAVERPGHPYKSAVQNRFTYENAKAA